MITTQHDHTTIFAIDPGNEKSAYVVLHGGYPTQHGIVENSVLSRYLTDIENVDMLAIEMVQSFGMPVGKEVFDTVLWAGRFVEMAFRKGIAHKLLYRKEIVTHICNSSKAKDSNIRRAMMDKFGGDESIKKGNILYKFRKDEWSALAIAVTAYET